MIKKLGKIRKFVFLGFVVMATGILFATSATFAAVPGAPKDISATAGDAKATVSFTPTTNGGKAITGYIVTSNPGNKTGSGTASPIVVSGLTNGTKYTFTVQAKNADGTSIKSSASTAITPTAAATGTGTPATDSTTGTLAQPGSQAIGVGVALPGTGIKSMGQYTFSVYVRAIYAYSMKVAVALATLMVIYAGYKYLTSRGDSSAINEAKDILFSTLLGAALLMLVVLVGNIVGLDITIDSNSITTSSLPLLTIFV